MSGRNISPETKAKRKWGEGEGENYHGWFSASSISLISPKDRIYGMKVNRIHLLVSTLERDYFYQLNFSDSVKDIREQYPLKRNITMAIAKEYGIRHIVKEPYTTDFYIIKSNGQPIARTLKYVKDLNEDARSIQEKFAIEQHYYADLGVDWKVVTEEDFDRTLSRHIADCNNCIDLSYYDKRFFDFEFYKDSIYALIDLLYKYSGTELVEIMKRYSSDINLTDGFANAYNIVKHMIVHKIIRIDMKKYLNGSKPLVILSCVEDLEDVLKTTYKKYVNGNELYLAESNLGEEVKKID